MNIIKLKDLVMPESPTDTPAERENIKFFNEHLKGRYAYWLQMRYIVSFDSLSHNGYVRCEEDIKRLIKDQSGDRPFPWGVPYWDVYDEKIYNYVDSEETDRINSIQEYQVKNKYVSDADITIDEIKIFRSWLATELLKFDMNPEGQILNKEFNEKESHMLQYYANNMYDDVIKFLNEYGTFNVNILNDQTKRCGCCGGGTNISSLYTENVQVCDTVAIYKNNMRGFMIHLFSDIEFWKRWPKEFLLVMKKYIDNIILNNLPLQLTVEDNRFVDCNCLAQDSQSSWQDILKRLSQSLQYLADNDLQNHKNYISDALRDWSSKLYENMYWM